MCENGGQTDGRRTTPTDGRQLDGYTISSPCEPNGSGELNNNVALTMELSIGRIFLCLLLRVQRN